MRAIGYLRVSTEEQRAGHGLDVQEEAIRRHCRSGRIRLVDLVTDAGVSGSNGIDGRPGLMSAIARLEAGEAELLLVYRLDRLARDLVLQEILVARLRSAGTPVRSVTEPDVETDTDDPTKILVRQILGALAQYERALIRARMMAGKAVKAAQGGYTGGQPAYGRRALGGELVSCDEEAALLRFAHALRTDGRSYRDIGRALDAAGFRPRRAQRWHPMVVRSLVQRASFPVPSGPRRSGPRPLPSESKEAASA